MIRTWNISCPPEPDDLPSVESVLELALDAAGLGYWDLDLATGWARCSLRAHQIFGYTNSRSHWALQSAVARVVVEDRDDVAEAFVQAASTGSIQFEKRIRRANDNETRWISVKGRVHAAQGEAGRVIGVVEDVTDRRRLEAQLRHSEKMAAMRDFSGRIAHDFNNLLMVISGNLEMLSARATRDEKASRSFLAARHGVERGATLSEQLLEFSRPAHEHLQTVSVDELIGSTQSALGQAAGDAVQIDVQRGPERWFCSADPRQFRSALVNLAANAGDAMPLGGVLTVSIDSLRLDKKTAHYLGSESGDYVVIAVRDTGAGIDPKILSRVAEPFFTTKAGGAGTGMGLSQVYGFAAQSGGFVTIESEPAMGTTVRIHLPCVAQR